MRRAIAIVLVVSWWVMAAAHAAKPNFVVIMADDMTVSMLDAMPLTRSLIGAQGTSFREAFVELALCCPSRATFLTGRYAHNHGVLNHDTRMGFRAFHTNGSENATIAVWLRAAGYRTALVGKYLNNYPDGDPTFIPPGWTYWVADLSNLQQGYNYRLNQNGHIVFHGNTADDFGVDVIGSHARAFIRRSASAGKPFFLFFTPSPPHWPYATAPRHAALFPKVKLRTPNFNEKDISDKPSFFQFPPLDRVESASRDENYADALRSLQSVDEAVRSFHDLLSDLGQLSNTYLIFTSDHGFHFAEHRLPQGKVTAFEEDLRVPLLVRGPACGRVMSTPSI
jgi:arylsulfatase A-like enzyme